MLGVKANSSKTNYIKFYNKYGISSTKLIFDNFSECEI